MGITHFMTEGDTGFSGVLKQRFSDFIVHEVRRAFPCQSSPASPSGQAASCYRTGMPCPQGSVNGVGLCSFVGCGGVVAGDTIALFSVVSHSTVVPYPTLTTNDCQRSSHCCHFCRPCSCCCLCCCCA